MNDSIKKKVFMFAEQVADEQGVEIFDIELLGNGKLLLRVRIDREGGVTLDDCENFSRAFGALLDVEDIFHGRYNLEVSSPGIDRPLRSLQEFEKHKGKLARIVTVEKINNQNLFTGRISAVSGNFVKLLENNQEIDIPFDRISKAKLEIEI
jgi:ribosome maturation factor RimP